MRRRDFFKLGALIPLPFLSLKSKVKTYGTEAEARPNEVTFTVDGLESGDRILVAPVNYSQMKFAGFGMWRTSLLIQDSIPLDTPKSGTIRVQAADYSYKRLEYDGYYSNTFTLSKIPDPFKVEYGADVFAAYIDTQTKGPSESFKYRFIENRRVFTRVRQWKYLNNEVPCILPPFDSFITVLRKYDPVLGG